MTAGYIIQWDENNGDSLITGSQADWRLSIGQMLLNRQTERRLITRQMLSNRQVPRRSVHRQTDHATFRPKRSVHPTNRLLWQFTTVTFCLKVDGLSVHPKMWHSNLVNLDGLSQSDKPTHCIVLTQSLWHFIHIFFVHCHLKGLSYEIFLLVFFSQTEQKSANPCKNAHLIHSLVDFCSVWLTIPRVRLG